MGQAVKRIGEIGRLGDGQYFVAVRCTLASSLTGHDAPDCPGERNLPCPQRSPTIVTERIRTMERVMSAASGPNIKAKVREALESLPDDASWDDVMYLLYVRQKVEAGLRDVDEGRTLSVEVVRRRFGLGS